MKVRPNPWYREGRAWSLPHSPIEWFAWALLVVGGLLLVAVLKGVVAAAVLAAVCGALSAYQRRRERSVREGKGQ
jgi:hypothetical protein